MFSPSLRPLDPPCVTAPVHPDLTAPLHFLDDREAASDRPGFARGIKTMKKFALTGAAAMLGLATFAHAQDAGDQGDGAETPDATETETDAGDASSNGAIVTREETTEDVAVLDENGEQVLDENGNPVYETRVTGWVQTVTTPSGITHTMTKTEAGRTIVTHDRSGMARPEKVAKAERPQRAERPERPEKPEKPQKPEKPEKPEKPGRN